MIGRDSKLFGWVVLSFMMLIFGCSDSSDPNEGAAPPKPAPSYTPEPGKADGYDVPGPLDSDAIYRPWAWEVSNDLEGASAFGAVADCADSECVCDADLICYENCDFEGCNFTCEVPPLCQLRCDGPCDAQCSGAGACEADLLMRGRFVCEDEKNCHVTAGPASEIDCRGSGFCYVNLGRNSEVQCSGEGECGIVCEGNCDVACVGEGDCQLSCEAGEDCEFSECKGEVYECGDGITQCGRPCRDAS